MKRFLVLTCLALGACAPYNQNSYDQNPYQNPPAGYVAQPAPSYELQPPAYEQSNWSIQQKEQEIFAKEKALLSAQDDLYRREKMLADKEAEFVTKSKALSYKEEMMNRPAPQQMNRPHPPVVRSQSRREIVTTYQPTVIMEEPTAYSTNVVTPQPQYQTTTTQEVRPAYASQPQEFTPSADGFIIMQHPVQRDLVRCPVTDDVCLASYERLGYVRAKNLSRFTAEEDCTLETSYPAGQWRDNNVVPRW